MGFSLKLLLSAENDIDNATDYYALISDKVLENFNNKLDEALISIQNNPFFQIRYKATRFLPVKNFPYIILFEIEEITETIYIISVFCTHQNPEKYP
jgi:plasmid stabilization system protein ParE